MALEGRWPWMAVKEVSARDAGQGRWPTVAGVCGKRRLTIARCATDWADDGTGDLQQMLDRIDQSDRRKAKPWTARLGRA